VAHRRHLQPVRPIRLGERAGDRQWSTVYVIRVHRISIVIGHPSLPNCPVLSQLDTEAERLNRVLTEGIEAALAEGKLFQTGVCQTLAAYRTTTHATTGVSPASLMLAFPVRTPLSALSQFTSTGVSTIPTSYPTVEKRVRFRQQRAAEAHDRRTGAKPTNITAGGGAYLPSAPGSDIVYSEPPVYME